MIAQEGAVRAAVRTGIALPHPDASRSRPAVDRAMLEDAVVAGRSLGFVAREPQEAPRPGRARRRRGTAKDRLCIAGPVQVTDAFRDLCARLAVPRWQVLDRLMRLAHASDGPPRRAIPDDSAAGAEPLPADVPAAPDGAARPADKGSVVTALRLPPAMRHWIDARVRSARYLDADDYLRDLVRRDQLDAAGLLALEAALRDAATGRDDTFDMTTFLRRRSKA